MLRDRKYFSDGNTILTYDKASNEVQINKFDPLQALLLHKKFLLIFMIRIFLYKLNGESRLAGKTMQEIELTPIR